MNWSGAHSGSTEPFVKILRDDWAALLDGTIKLVDNPE
jgi:hypothetical protein